MSHRNDTLEHKRPQGIPGDGAVGLWLLMLRCSPLFRHPLAKR